MHDKIWVCSLIDSSIGIYDTATGQTIDLDDRYHFDGFSDIRACRDVIYCFSRYRSQILKIYALTKQMQLFQTKENFDVIEIAGHAVYAFSFMPGNMHRTDLETMEQWVSPMVCPAEMPEINYQNALKESERYNNGHVLETAFLNLDALVGIAKTPIVEGKNKKNSGEMIYQYIKGLVE